MENYKEIKKFFKENGTSPCKILGVSKNVTKKELKKAYYKKSLELHPDKNRNGDPEEFKVLQLAYIYMKKYIEQHTEKNFLELKNQEPIEATQTDQFFINTQSPKGGYGDIERNTHTSYTSAKTEISVPEQLMKRFNLKKFNQIFEFLDKNENLEDTNSLIKLQELQTFSKDRLEPTKVITDGEVMYIGEGEELDDYSTNFGSDYKKGFNKFECPGKSKLKGFKYNTKEEAEPVISKRDIVNYLEIYKKTPEVNQQSEHDFINQQLENLRRENNKNKTFINRNKYLFPTNDPRNIQPNSDRI